MFLCFVLHISPWLWMTQDKRHDPVLIWPVPSDSPRNTGRDTKRHSISASEFTRESHRKSTDAQPNCSKRCFAGMIWVICFAPCFPWMVKVCLHWLSPNTRFPIHPIPRKPHESQLSASSFVRYVESQILRVIKSPSSNIITLYSSLDCHWMCKKKIRRSTSRTNLQCISKSICCVTLTWKRKREEWGTERDLHNIGFAESGAVAQHVFWDPSAHTTGIWSGVRLEAFYSNQVPACLNPVYYRSAFFLGNTA